MKTLLLPSGVSVPVLGQGTWRMGEDPSQRKAEIAALRLGVDLGMTLIDTAEMYVGAEEVIAEALRDRRSEIFLVSKVMPNNATRHGTIKACENSLKRLKTDFLDLYLLHWRESVPLEETFEAFQLLKRDGKIKDYGVSNFDLSDMKEAMALNSGEEIATNQVYYNLLHRGIEWDLLPWCRKRALPIMSYSPIEKGEMSHNSKLKSIAKRHNATPTQIALAWLIHQKNVIVIPKAGQMEHVRENRRSLEIQLSKQDLIDLNNAFPPPHQKDPLAIL